MRKRPSAEVPPDLDRVRREIEQWRGCQSSRKRLPREFWAKAVDLARVHGVNRTARPLGLKYASLRQHLERAGAASPAVAPAFLELLGGPLAAASLTCRIELDEGHGATLRIDVQGATMADLAAFAARWRSGRP